MPLDVGGRLTGRIGAFSVGALTIRTGAEPVSATPATTFTAIRLKRDVLRRSSIGAIVTRRSVSTKASGSNETYGLDGTFGFYDNLSLNTYWAKTQTQGVEDDVSYRAQFHYAGDRYGVEVERLVVGAGFNPEIGFLLRDDFERSFGSVRFSPRPRSIAAIRKFSWSAQMEYITDRAGVLETREAEGRFGIELENGDAYDLSYTRTYEFLEQPFPIAPRVTIPVGGYSFQDVRTSYSFRVPAPAGGAALGPARQLLQRGEDKCQLRARRWRVRWRAPRADAAVVRRAGLVVQLGRPAGGKLLDPARDRANDLHRHAADVRQRPGPVQLQQRLPGREPAVPVGVSTGQRAVRGLQRTARHDDARLSGAGEPSVHRED